MKVGAFELTEPLPELREPHALAMLRPWIDVGSVGSLALARLESHLQAQELGKLAKPGMFFDFHPLPAHADEPGRQAGGNSPQ